MQITRHQQKASEEIIELIANELGENRSIHPGTAIISCARLAGSFMFRSFNFKLGNLQPGNAVLSDEANQKGPILINILQWMLNNLEVNIDNSKLEKAPMTESDLDFVDTLHLLQNKAVHIEQQNKLDHEQMAYSCCMAVAFIIKECKNDLPVEAAFNSAVYSFIEGCKTCPPEFSEASKKKKGFFTFWK